MMHISTRSVSCVNKLSAGPDNIRSNHHTSLHYTDRGDIMQKQNETEKQMVLFILAKSF